MVCQVLRWLGVAELGRAQLVCRQWRDLIRGAERCDDHDHSSGADHVLKDSIADDLWRAAFLQTWPLPSLELAPTSELGSGNHTSEEEDDDDDDSKPSVRLADEEEDDAGGCAGGTDNDALLGGCRWMQIARERWILQKKNTTQPRAADEEGAEEDAIADDATKRNEKGFGDIVEQMRASVSELLEDPQQLTSAHAHAALSALAATVLYRAIKARYRIEPAHGMDDGESEYHAVEAVFYSLTTGEPVYVFYTYRYKALETGTMWEYIQCREKRIAWGSKRRQLCKGVKLLRGRRDPALLLGIASVDSSDRVAFWKAVFDIERRTWSI